MDPYTPNPNTSAPSSGPQRPANNLAERTRSALGRDFVVIGRTHVRAWQAWLMVGLGAGIAAGVILVASRSGELPPGQAQTAPSTYTSGMFGLVQGVNVANRQLTMTPWQQTHPFGQCTLAAAAFYQTSGFPSVLNVSPTAEITRYGVPISLSAVSPQDVVDVMIVSPVGSWPGASGSEIQSIRVLNTPTTAGRIQSATTQQFVVSSLSAQTVTFTLASNTAVFTLSAAGFQSGTAADLVPNRNVVVRWVQLPSGKQAAQVAVQTGPIGTPPPPSVTSYSVFGGVNAVDPTNNLLRIIPSAYGTSQGSCFVLDPYDAFGLWLYWAFVDAFHGGTGGTFTSPNYPFNFTLVPGAVISRLGLPIQLADLKLRDQVLVEAVYDSSTRRSSASSVNAANAPAAAGTVAAVTSAVPQSVTIRTRSGTLELFAIVSGTDIFVVAANGSYQPGTVADLAVGKAATVQWVNVQGVRTAALIAVQQ